ncbi:hypothetical protein H112_06708 [Trichophyton rubrum D6]|uniref:Endosomal/vacuolar adapter protein YPT35 n=3 Tax=Trichophyton TaxID=5550 RepID=F2SJ72_TRIRC|nr:uncharacterized protein TERG_02056 [Trichophyton rubrum CBS 118892]EZF12398.1 hypothetical protein H100_06724 [Trichophyton rubrum MR850]EZF39368.1 hypothetical protein H102_06691 [Trichophyton rubrum CBS 100081]EZF49822.1 hypothetical protein H103_06715 [Trichophyton rubrum CBS 288.86]EZF60396.1 hypothetical protein H104_06670 [Trichophyton rubrum CBS 289.86]EZF71104.1 hypothetical protein H105_06728 [Trichophyton soudanense CBS 452.61]EZF81843.1 hypothetical protein H110_06712 [Trichophy
MLPQPLHVDSIGAETASAPRAGTPQSNPQTATPPYWKHSRNISHASHTSLDRSSGLITLEDHSEDPSCDKSKGLWAKNVTIDNYAVVKGQSGIGAYVVWICNIQTLEGASMVVRMRYSQFVDLRCKLAEAYPHCKKSLPVLPPKSALFKFNAKFLETRRQGLAYFLNCVLLNPEFSGSPILKNTLFTHSA